MPPGIVVEPLYSNVALPMTNTRQGVADVGIVDAQRARDRSREPGILRHVSGGNIVDLERVLAAGEHHLVEQRQVGELHISVGRERALLTGRKQRRDLVAGPGGDERVPVVERDRVVGI